MSGLIPPQPTPTDVPREKMREKKASSSSSNSNSQGFKDKGEIRKLLVFTPGEWCGRNLRPTTVLGASSWGVKKKEEERKKMLLNLQCVQETKYSRFAHAPFYASHCVVTHVIRRTYSVIHKDNDVRGVDKVEQEKEEKSVGR